MMLGYPANHPPGTFRMLKLSTNNVIHSRDIIWIGQMHSEFQARTHPTPYDKVPKLPPSPSSDIDNDLLLPTSTFESDSSPSSSPTPELNSKQQRELSRLHGFFNDTTSEST